MKIISLDPRIARAEVPEPGQYHVKEELDQWQTYEVFHQKSRGTQHLHVGVIHAPNDEMAMNDKSVTAIIFLGSFSSLKLFSVSNTSGIKPELPKIS